MISTLQILLLTARAQLQMLQLVTEAPLAAMQVALNADRIHVEHLGYGVDMWRDLEAAIKPNPQLNVMAMWLCQHLRSPIQVPVVYGPVIFTGNIDGKIASLVDGPLHAFHEALALVSPTEAAS